MWCNYWKASRHAAHSLTACHGWWSDAMWWHRQLQTQPWKLSPFLKNCFPSSQPIVSIYSAQTWTRYVGFHCCQSYRCSHQARSLDAWKCKKTMLSFEKWWCKLNKNKSQTWHITHLKQSWFFFLLYCMEMTGCLEGTDGEFRHLKCLYDPVSAVLI